MKASRDAFHLIRLLGLGLEEHYAQARAPFTATVGVEYKFSMFNHDSFVRVDDEYEGRAKWLSPGQDPTTQQYDSANYVLSPTMFSSARAGMSFGNLELAAFVDNLTDTHTITNYNWTIDYGGGPSSRLQRPLPFRPSNNGFYICIRQCT